MLSRLSNARSEIIKNQVYSINKIIDIVEYNSKNQLGLGLKFLAPNQMLSRLPIKSRKQFWKT